MKNKSLSSFLKGLGILGMVAVWSVICFVGTIKYFSFSSNHSNSEYIFIVAFGIWLVGIAVLQQKMNKL